MKRGGVWWVEFDPSVGSEIRKTRPAVIVSNNMANQFLARVVVVPLTGNVSRLYPGEALVTVYAIVKCTGGMKYPMTIEQTVEIPADRQLRFTVPGFRPSKNLKLNSKKSIPPKPRSLLHLYFPPSLVIIQDMQVNVDIPDMIAVSAPEARFFLAAKLFEVEKLSLGQAADLCGLSKRAFMEMLNQWDVPVFTLTAAELQSDIANAKRFALPHNR